MSFWDKLRNAMREPDEEIGLDPDREFDPDDFVKAYEPPTDLATLLNRVVQYRNDEIRDLRSTTYEAKAEAGKLQREMSILKYERDEALQRVAKLLAVLNKKQLAAIQKAPFEYRFGPPVIEILGYDEKGNYRPIPVPAPATMKTVKRKGSHGGVPLGHVAQVDRRTERD